jgi:DNA-binding MarR family transcriptional regulator
MVARRSSSVRRKAPAEATGKAPGEAEGHAIAPNLDRVIHEPVRLGILSALAVNATLSFRELKDLLNTTDGNLSIHARKLEEASYLRCTKNFEGRVQRTRFRITPGGRRALEDYIRHMEALIRATRR